MSDRKAPARCPGPACYGKGGDRPTVTDANVVLGRLPPRLLGGKMMLDTKAAEEAVAKIARALSLDLHQAAQGILDIVNENMFGALRLVTVQKGLDPRDFALVPFGGAGPLHGNAMAMLAGCYPVIVPPTPGVLSALGFLYSDVKNEFAQTFVRTIDDADPSQIGDILTKLGPRRAGMAARRGHRGAAAAPELRGRCPLFPAGLRILPRDRSRTGSAAARSTTSPGVSGWRTSASMASSSISRSNSSICARSGSGRCKRSACRSSTRKAPMRPRRWSSSIAPISTAASLRLMSMTAPMLRAGNRVRGPAIVVQMDATTVIHPNHTGEVDEYLSILIRPDKAS